MANKLSRLDFGAIPRAQVALLEAENVAWPELKEIAAGFSFLELPTSHPAYRIRTLNSTLYLALRHHIRLGLAQLGPLCRKAEVQTLLATEGGHRDHIAALAFLLPNLRQILISHGSVRVDNIDNFRIVPNSDSQTVVAWGNADFDTYKKSGVKLPKMVVAGSLRNSFYWARYRNGKPVPDKKYPISFVSNFSDLTEESSNRPIRTRVLKSMKANLARYCKERSLPVRILLRPGSSGEMLSGAKEREIQHFKEIFADIPFAYSDTSTQYATYLDSDYSDVTVGVPSGSLTESFGRGNKVLMIGQEPSTGDYLGFPRKGLYILHEPNYKVFAERLDMIREMSTKSFANQFESDREYVVTNATSDKTIQIISELIKYQVTKA